MKSSEIIRNAIDNHLVWEDDAMLGENGLTSHWLCWAVVIYMLGHEPTKAMYRHIDELPENVQLICKILADETSFSELDVGVHERQQLRYMYADFLAMYFEDMGD